VNKYLRMAAFILGAALSLAARAEFAPTASSSGGTTYTFALGGDPCAVIAVLDGNYWVDDPDIFTTRYCIRHAAGSNRFDLGYSGSSSKYGWPGLQFSCPYYVCNFGYVDNPRTSLFFNCPANSTLDPIRLSCSCDTGFDDNPSTLKTCAPLKLKNDAQKPQPQPAKMCVSNPIYPLTGAKKEFIRTGMAIGGLKLSLVYDTTSALPANRSKVVTSLVERNSFGALWRSSLHHKLQISLDGKQALLSRGNGEILNFEGPGAGVFTSSAANPHKLAGISGGYRFTDIISGAIETFDTSGKLLSLAAANGTVLTFTYSAENLTKVLASDGRSIRFAYTDGLITRIIGPDASVITAAYDTNKNLVALTWPDTKVFGMLYENAALPWALTGKVDENNSRFATFAYDPEGRAIYGEHAGVENFSVSYATAPTRVVTDTFDGTTIYRTHSWSAPTGTSVTTPNGQSVAVEAQLVVGMPALASQSQSAGSGCAASTSSVTYDGDGNVLSKDDFQGARTCYAYDANGRETVRVEGLETTAVCLAVLPGGAILPAGARKVITTWHPDWGMPSEVVSPLRKISTIYHGQSDPFNGNAVANCTAAAPRADSKPLPLVCKQVEQATMNSAGADQGDPLLGSVQLLLHGEGSNGGTSIVDSSPNNLSPASQTGMSITTADKKLGSAALSAASGGSLKYTGNAGLLFTGDFTAEGDFKVPVNNQNIQFFNFSTSEAPGRIVAYTSGTGTLRYNRYGSNEITINSSTTLIPVGTWFHLAVVRSGSTISYYVNGTNVGTTSDAGTFGNGTGGFGIATSAPNGLLFDEVRVTKGVTRYTANFTPPTQEFLGSSPAVASSITSYTYDYAGRVLNSVDANLRTTTYAYFTDSAFPGAADPYADSVALLLHGNGTNNATAIVDDGPLHKTVSVVGNAKISTAQSMLGGAAMAFDGAGDYITIPYSSDFSFGAGDFTIETFLYKNGNNANYSRIWNPDGDIYDGVSMTIDPSGTFGVYLSTTGNSWPYSLAVANLANGQWYHLALVRSGGSVFAFVNGVKYTVTTSLGASALYSYTASGRVIGGQSGVDRALNGYIDEFRITTGVARYTGNFTPPTQEFASTTPAIASTGHMVGDLQSVTNAAGHTTQFNLYDPAGRVCQMTDPKGVVTDITYTSRGWVSAVVVTPPGGSARTTAYTYDFVGQLTGVASPDGTSVSYTYDAAHRLTGATDARGNSVTYTLDSVGNRTSEAIKDPSGTLQRSIGRSFDALNRLQQVTGAAR
jgi:YD repeat-containing protein